LALLLLLLAPALCGAATREFAGTFEVTAYCSCPLCCGKDARGITASGRPVQWGVVAADWRVLPEGTRIRLASFPGAVFTVLDTGSAIKGRRIDVWMPSHRLAQLFGRRKVALDILRSTPVVLAASRPRAAANNL
jgi:3D (Asp-Asp-Asp) domain-containing protein